jgi:DNA primase
VEGVFDAWRIGDGAIATFGTQFTDEQLLMISKFKQVFVMYDQDAIDDAHRLANILMLFVPVKVLELDSGDPDDLEDYQVREIRRDLRL